MHKSNAFIGHKTRIAIERFTPTELDDILSNARDARWTSNKDGSLACLLKETGKGEQLECNPYIAHQRAPREG